MTALELLNAYADAEESLFTHEQGAPKAFAALRAVLALHKPDEYGDCVECGVTVHEDPVPYPCDTANAITGELEK